MGPKGPARGAPSERQRPAHSPSVRSRSSVPSLIQCVVVLLPRHTVVPVPHCHRLPEPGECPAVSCVHRSARGQVHYDSDRLVQPCLQLKTFSGSWLLQPPPVPTSAMSHVGTAAPASLSCSTTTHLPSLTYHGSTHHPSATSPLHRVHTPHSPLRHPQPLASLSHTDSRPSCTVTQAAPVTDIYHPPSLSSDADSQLSR